MRNFRDYQTMRIIMRLSDHVLQAVAMFLMITGSLFIIVCSFVSVKPYRYIPMPFFYAFNVYQ